FRLPTLELYAIWTGMFQEPIGLAADSKGRIYVLDQKLKRVFRFNTTGLTDSTYSPLVFNQPVFLAIDGQDQLYVSDAETNQVLRFRSDGNPLNPPLPSASMLPRALAARGDC